MENLFLKALSDGVSVEILSVNEYKPLGKLLVVTRAAKGFEDSRREVTDYHFISAERNTDLNAEIAVAQEKVLAKYYGMTSTDEKPAKRQELAEVIEIKKTEEVKEEPKKKAATKKKAIKKAAKKAPPPPAEDEGFPDLDDEEDEPELELDAENQLFDKASVSHKDILRPYIDEALGKDWRKDPESMKTARRLIGALHQKVEVTDGEGVELESFAEAVDKLLS